MEFKMDGAKVEKTGDELIQQVLKDILTGLRKKMTQPVLEENIKLAARLEELTLQNRAEAQEIMVKLEALEEKVQQMPLIILAALRDAVNQAGGGSPDAQ